MAQTLATFDLSRAKDESGKLIELTMEYTDEGVRYVVMTLGFCSGLTSMIVVRSHSHVCSL